jgi:hypothetical protein
MERKTIEKSVEESIIAYISQIKMGQPLLFSQLTRQILSVTNVYNIERFEICTYVPIDNGSIPSTPTQCYADNDSRKQIDIGEAQKIYLRKIWVTSQVKTVPIVIQFKINQDIQSSQEPEIINKLLEYFNSLKSGDSVKKGDIENKIAEAQAQITVEDKDLKLQVQASDLSPLAVVTLEEIKLSFAEKAELDKENLFIYRNILKIVGAVQFTPPKTTNDEEKNKIKQKIIDSLNDYLATLKPEENVDIDGLEKAAKNVVNDMPVKLNINDLITLINDQEELRISQKQIEVKQWEKAQLGNFCVTSEIESIKVDITKLSLKLVIPNPPPSGFKQTDVIEPIQKAVTKAIQEFPKPEQGKNLSYASLQQAILTPISSPELQNLLRGVTYVIENFDLIATSKSDNRTQTRNINNNKEIHVRSVEIIKEINPPATVEVK